MATTRINGQPFNLERLTDSELDAMLSQAANRIATANNDIAKLRREQLLRRHEQLPIRSPWGVDDPWGPPAPRA